VTFKDLDISVLVNSTHVNTISQYAYLQDLTNNHGHFLIKIKSRISSQKFSSSYVFSVLCKTISLRAGETGLVEGKTSVN